MRSLAIVLVVSALGCSRSLGSAGAPVVRDVTALPVPRRQGPNAYTVNLVPQAVLQPVAAGSAASAPAERATGSLRVVLRDDNTIEYQLTIFNEDRHTFTAGHVYRRTPDQEHLVATLFTGEMLSSRYIQLRGTGSVVKAASQRALLDQLRDSPADFLVRIDGRAGSTAILQGTLRQ